LSRAATAAEREFSAAVVQHLGEAARPVVPGVKPEELVPGARVKLRGIARRGMILSKLDASTVEVQVGSIRMRARAHDVEGVEAAAPETRKAKLEIRKEKIGSEEAAAPLELHVRGMRVEEALEIVDKFLDEAVLAGHTEVRIVHGIGKGTLKKALGEFLASHPHVESSREADRQHGGAGVTVVELKRN
jgi:DNA mismatch repair protein MutS2